MKTRESSEGKAVGADDTVEGHQHQSYVEEQGRGGGEGRESEAGGGGRGVTPPLYCRYCVSSCWCRRERDEHIKVDSSGRYIRDVDSDRYRLLLAR